MPVECPAPSYPFPADRFFEGISLIQSFASLHIHQHVVLACIHAAIYPARSVTQRTNRCSCVTNLFSCQTMPITTMPIGCQTTMPIKSRRVLRNNNCWNQPKIGTGNKDNGSANLLTAPQLRADLVMILTLMLSSGHQRTRSRRQARHFPYQEGASQHCYAIFKFMLLMKEC